MQQNKDIRKNKPAAFLFCGLIMLITAASDALRGVFLPELGNAFTLSETQSSMIIMISYVGNLLFLSVGGRLSDRLPKKRFLAGVLLIWCSALAVYVFTESYGVLLVTMIFSMGCSTLISTTVNLITPLLFTSPAMLVSIFNFVQGIGITASQNIGGRFADRLGSWHIANAIILGIALICSVLLFVLKLPRQDTDPPETTVTGGSMTDMVFRPASLLLILICGFYFIAEHGLMNWLTSYGSKHLGYTVQEAAFYLSLFFGGITVGRLIFAPLIDRVGIFRSLLIWSSAGAGLYILGMALGRGGMLLIGASGLGFSIIYPMLVMLIGKYFPPSETGTATGMILSIATLFDIGFNAFFGSLVESVGYAKAMIVLPFSAGAFAVLLFVLKYAVGSSKEIR